MTTRDQTELYQGIWLCASQHCEAITDVIHTKKGPVIDNVLMRRGTEEIRLCLLCHLSQHETYEKKGFQFVQRDSVKK